MKTTTKCNRLMVIFSQQAYGGGSNSSRSRPWKKKLQLFASETGLEIKVCHFPPETSKWNKIEHRLFIIEQTLTYEKQKGK